MARSKKAPYRLHIGLKITQKVLWTMLTDLQDEPHKHFQTVAGALRWLDREGYDTVEYRAGDFTGTMDIKRDKLRETDIVYFTDNRYRNYEGGQVGENNGPTTQLWGEWHYRENPNLR